MLKTLGEVLTLATQYLQERRVSSPRFVAETLLAHTLGKKRMDLYMNFECPLEEKELADFRSRVKRAGGHEPIEYILGFTTFYGCTLTLSKEVLIPRPETEILVDEVAKLLSKEALQGKTLLDLCTGSGCIGLSLKKKFPPLSVVLSDLSQGALATAKENASKNGLEVELLLGDLLAPFQSRLANYVVCNPPYITSSDYTQLDPSVKNYEPSCALIGGENGLLFYERLANELPSHLAPQAKVFFEIGTGQGEALKKIFSSPIWKKKEVLSDFAGHDRFFFLEIE